MVYTRSYCDDSDGAFVNNREDVFIGAMNKYYVADPLSFSQSRNGVSTYSTLDEYYDGIGCQQYDSGWPTFSALETDLKITLPLSLSN